MSDPSAKAGGPVGGLAAMLSDSISKKSPIGGAPGDDTDGDPSADGSADEGEQAAAEDMMHALDGRDPNAFATALKSFVEICMSKYG